MQPDALALLGQEREPEAALAAARSGGATWHRLSAALDEAIRTLAAPALGPGQAVLAAGSYARREQSRHAEVELLLLAPGDATEIVHAILGPLWDAGIRTRYTVRPSIGPTGTRDLIADVIAMLDARLVCGDIAAFDTFAAARRTLVRRRRGALRAELRRRHASVRAAEPWQTLEPDIVASRGGLNSLLTVHWLALVDAIADGRQPPSLADPSSTLGAQYEVLMRILNVLHALRDERDDHLRRTDAAAVATYLGGEGDTLIHDLLLAMRTIDRAANEALDARRGIAAILQRLVQQIPGFMPELPPDLDDTHGLLRALRSPVDTLEPLPPAPWLTRLLPEWEVVRARPPAQGIHAYPVDTHLLRTVREAVRGLTEDLDNSSTPIVAAELIDQDELLLGALLHDIGEGHEGDHARAGAVIAERFAARAGLDVAASRRLVTVVEQHRLLPTVSSGRDLAEERVIADVAAAAGDPETLHLLYLVAVADARANGAGAWSGWRAAQLRTLYVRALHHMTGETGDDRTAIERRHDAVIQALAPRFGVEAIETHLAQLPSRYLLAMAPETIGDHLAMIAECGEATAVRHDPVGDFERLTVVTADRPGILSLVAGALALHQLSVLGGNAYARDDGLAIEVLHVADSSNVPIDAQRWARICAAIPEALDGRFPVERLLEESRALRVPGPGERLSTSVQIDNTDSDGYSIVEVRTGDRLGLLFAITHALHESGLDIHLAKVDTIGHEVADVFYVLRRNGRRVEAPDEIERVCQRVREAIAALDG